jgi:ABC-type branched-subunit amino acid transport system substrate-binding protein
MKITPITYLSLGTFVGIFIAIKFLLSDPIACDQNSQDNPHLSCGEKILLIPPGGKSRDDKQKGVEAFKSGHYPSAIAHLQQDWNLNKDPETLIVLENAKIANDKNAKFKTIAVVIPATQTPIFVPTGILKGVAYAQSQWNKDLRHAWQLRVVIADDANDPQQGEVVAKEILKRDDILAIVGHYSSEVTTNVRALYQQAQTVLISGTSTSTALTIDDPNNFFFRTCSSNRVAGAIMAKYWAIKHKKIAIFYTPGQKFSESIRGAFIDNLKSVAVVKEFNLSTPANAKTELAKKLGATGIVLFPDAYTVAIERDRVSSLIVANNGELPLLANETVNDDLLLKFEPKLIDKLTLSLPWHPSDIHHQNYQLFQAAPNWWGTKKELNARIVMSYDAAKVLLVAADKLDIKANLKLQKQQLQKIINPPIFTGTTGVDGETKISFNNGPVFTTTGITGKISFNGRSDRDGEINSLVKPICNATKCQGFKPAF